MTGKSPVPLEFYDDEAGDPRARGGPGRDLLARFLESDVQGSAAHGREILAAIDRVTAGKEARWERTGNAYTLVLRPGGAAIEPEMDENAAPLHLPLAELRQAVAGWVAHVGERRR